MRKLTIRRKQFLLSDFQVRMLLFTFLYFVITVVILAAVLFVPLMTQLDTEGLSPEQRGIVAGEFLSLHYRFWPAIPLVLALIGAHSLLVSHRVAGPLYRFRQVQQDIGKGDLSGNVRLRKNDYLKEDGENLGEMLDSLRNRIREIDYLDEKLQSGLVELRAAVEDGTRPEVHDRLGDVEDKAGKLRSQLKNFTLDEES